MRDQNPAPNANPMPEEPQWAVTYCERMAAWGVAAHSIHIHDTAHVPHQFRGPRFHTSEEANQCARTLNLGNFHPDQEA